MGKAQEATKPTGPAPTTTTSMLHPIGPRLGCPDEDTCDRAGLADLGSRRHPRWLRHGRSVATLLNSRDMRPKRGDRWHAQTVSRALARKPASVAG
jgi:hypothetical protein